MSRPHRRSSSDPGGQQHVHDAHAGTGNAPTTSMTPSPSFSPPPHVIPQTRASSRSEGYPSWLPRRPPPPAPQSTIHSSRVPTYAGEDEAPIKRSSFFGVGRKPTPRSMRVVSLQDSPTPLNRAGSYGNRLASPGGRRVWSRATGSPFASTLIGGGGRASSFFGTAATAAAAIRPRFKSTALRLELLRSPFWFTRLRFYLFPLFVFAHIPLQTFFDFNAVFILFKVAQLPNSAAPGVQGSGSGWTLAAVVYIACWAIWLFLVVFLYEFIYSFVRRWRIKRPLITPLYLSSAGFNYVSMTSYTHFCFFQHIRLSAFTPSSGGSLHDGLAETCWFYAQNWPTVALLLPRAGLCVALLLALSGPQPGLVALADQGITRDSAVYFRAGDGGALTGYARGVLYANAAWTAWRALVVLASWTGLWILSGHGCAGLCGPRYRWEEEAAAAAIGGGEKMSMYSEAGILPDIAAPAAAVAARPPSTMPGAPSSTAAPGTTILNPAAAVTAASTIDEEQQLDALPWSWRQHTRERIFDAWEFCLTVKPLRWASNSAAFANGRKEPGAGAGPVTATTPVPPDAANNAGAGNEKAAQQQQQQKPAFEGVEQVIAAVGLPGHPLPAKRGVLSEQLFESPVEGSYVEKRQQQPQAGPSRHHISEGEEDSEPVSSEDAAARAAGAGTTSGSAAESSSHEGVNTPIRKGTNNKKQKPTKLGPAVSSPYPYPFTPRGSQFSSEDKIPFPPSPSRSRADELEGEEAPEGEEEGEEVYEDEEEDEVASRDPSSGRTSASLSSLGQPIVSRYPFQFRQPTRGGSLSSSGIQSHATPRSGIISGTSANSGSGSGASPPSSTTNSRSHYSHYSHFSQSTGNRESSDSHSPSSQGGGSGSGGADSSAASAAALGLAYSPIPHPPRHPSHQQHVGRMRAGTNPVVSPTPAQRRRRRPRGSAGSAIAAPTMMAAATTTTSSSTTRRPVGAATATAVDPDVSYEPSVHEEYLDNSGSGTGDDSIMEQPEAEEEEVGPQEEAEQGDNVGLLYSDSRGPSPRASFVSLHRLRTRSGSSRHHRVSVNSSSNAGGASSSSSSARSRTGSSVSQSVRSRAQSMVHSIGAASRSSLDLAYAAVVATRTRTRAHSSLARLQDEEAAAAAAWGSGHSRSGSGSNSDAIMSSPENYTFGHPMREQWRREEEAAAAVAAANGGGLLPGGVERIEEESGSFRSNTSDGSRGMVTEAHYTAPSEPHSVPPSTFGGRSAGSERSPSEFTASNESQQQPTMEGDGLDREHRRRRQSSSATGGALTIRGLTTTTEPYADGETESSASRPDISTAAGSFVTAPATPDDATESSEGGRTMASSNWNVFRAMPPHHHGHGHGWQHGPA